MKSNIKSTVLRSRITEGPIISTYSSKKGESTISSLTDALGDQNAFSNQLSQFGFNFYDIFVVDLMHDFELGGWRALLIHLLRILDLLDGNLLMELDRR
jgi:hypothetical protein